jgi:hypothetical protein
MSNQLSGMLGFDMCLHSGAYIVLVEDEDSPNELWPTKISSAFYRKRSINYTDPNHRNLDFLKFSTLVKSC